MNNQCTTQSWADYLVARLRPEPGVFPNPTLDYDWKILMAWPEVSRCWIAVAAIVQIVLQHERHEHTSILAAARSWLADVSVANSSLYPPARPFALRRVSF